MSPQRGRASGAPRRAPAGASGRSAAAPRGDARVGPPPAAHRDRVLEIVTPVVAESGYDLEDLKVTRVGRRHLVQIMVDSDTGVDLDRVAVLSRAVAAALDDAEAGGDEVISGEYELQVGSPGVDRPLTEPRHWRRNVDRLVAVRVGGAQVTGRIVGADESGVRLDVDGDVRAIPYADLGAGQVQLEFKRRPQAGDDAEDADLYEADDEADDFDDEDDDDDDEREDEE